MPMPETPIEIECQPFGVHTIHYARLLELLQAGIVKLQEQDTQPLAPEMPEPGTQEFDDWYEIIDLHDTITAGQGLVTFLCPPSRPFDIPF